MKKTKKNHLTQAFTLIELLAVLFIIALLATLSIPAVTGVLRKARQAGDVSNIRQLGMIMFSYASDHDFTYPQGATSPEVFQTLIDEGYLKSLDILVSTGSGQTPGTMAEPLSANNVSFHVTVLNANQGVTDHASDLLPLIFSADTGLASVDFPTEAVTQKAGKITIIEGDGPWKKDGITVFRKGNSASFLKANRKRELTKKHAFFPVGYEDEVAYSIAVRGN